MVILRTFRRWYVWWGESMLYYYSRPFVWGWRAYWAICYWIVDPAPATLHQDTVRESAGRQKVDLDWALPRRLAPRGSALNAEWCLWEAHAGGTPVKKLMDEAEHRLAVAWRNLAELQEHPPHTLMQKFIEDTAIQVFTTPEAEAEKLIEQIEKLEAFLGDSQKWQIGA